MSTASATLVLGIDVGTQGVRAIVSDLSGNVVGTASRPLRDDVARLPDGWHEQNPREWWDVCCQVLQEIFKGSRRDLADCIGAVCVDSTSGTIVPVDKRGESLMNAIMYNDGRAAQEAKDLNAAFPEYEERFGVRFSTNFAAPRILWLKRNRPDVYARASRFLHATDFINAKLLGKLPPTDVSSALKTGCDTKELCWPEELVRAGIDIEKLPEIVMCGERIGSVCAAAARATGLREGTAVVAGMTDGTAGFLASGAVADGDCNVTMGTTLVLKAVSPQILRDPLGRVYCHRHPSGGWLPGGASNVGGEALAQEFGNERLAELDRQAERSIPTNLLVYPLKRKGERMPFVSPDATGFEIGDARSEAERYAAYLEGIAHVERWCIDVLEELGLQTGPRVFATGGGAKSTIWLRIRASVLGRTYVRPKVAESAFGSCVLAAGSLLGGLGASVRSMVHADVEVEPDAALNARYEERYAAFREACAERGYGVSGTPSSRP